MTIRSREKISGPTTMGVNRPGKADHGQDIEQVGTQTLPRAISSSPLRAAVMAAAAQTRSPISQALVAMTQPFIDTIVVCTMTGIVLIITNSWSNGATGAELSTIAYAAGMPGGAHVVSIGIALFA